jgi:di/tricarboxylate transporter
MSFELIVVVLVMLGCFAAMVRERVPVDVVALCGMGVLIITGVLTPGEAFSVFSNEAAITVASMFVLSAALIRTGSLEGVIRWFDRAGGGSETRLLLLVLPVTALMSAFVNNTPIVVMLIPVLIAQAARHGMNQSALLLPLSYASIMGGLCTLVGTSTTILVSSTAERLGQRPIKMFEVTPLGLMILAGGFLFLFFGGRRLLPARKSLSQTVKGGRRTYLSELVVTPDSRWIGSALASTPLAAEESLRVLDVRRRGGVVAVPLAEIRLQRGDILRVASPLDKLVELKNLPGLHLQAEHQYAGSIKAASKTGHDAHPAPEGGAAPKNGDKPAQSSGGKPASGELRIVECLIAPGSRLRDRSVRQLDFRRRFGVLVAALHRRGGVTMERDFANLPLEPGDTLLLMGEEDAIRRLDEDEDFLILTQVAAHKPRRSKRWIALALVASVVGLATAGVLPIAALALMGALLCVVTRCLDGQEAHQAVDWRIVLMIYGMLSIGLAMEKTGGAALAAQGLLAVFKGAGPWVILSVLLLLTSFLTEFLSNNAVAVLMTPIAVSLSESLGIDARPLLIAVVVGASASFATPIGYQTNTLVYGAGGYKFSDFLRIGLPLNLMAWLIGTLAIPFLWPFQAR